MCPLCKRRTRIHKTYTEDEGGKKVRVQEHICTHKDCPLGKSGTPVKVTKKTIS